MALNSVQRSELNSEFVRGKVLELEFQPGGQSMTTECPHTDAIRTCKNICSQVCFVVPVFPILVGHAAEVFGCPYTRTLLATLMVSWSIFVSLSLSFHLCCFDFLRRLLRR